MKYEVIHQWQFWTQYWQKNVILKQKVADIYPLSDYTYPIIVDAWIGDDCNRSLVLVGESGIGKTSLARSIAGRLGDFFWATDINSLQGYGQESCIIFDDVGLQAKQRENIISICDVEQLQTIRVLYGTTSIPAGTRRIFSCNSLRHLLGDKEFDPAIKRRMLIVELEGTLYKQPTFGLQRAEELPSRFVRPDCARRGGHLGEEEED